MNSQTGLELVVVTTDVSLVYLAPAATITITPRKHPPERKHTFFVTLFLFKENENTSPSSAPHWHQVTLVKLH